MGAAPRVPDDLRVYAIGDIHGHTPTRQPVLAANRIGLDTGAFSSGRLSAVVLSGATRRILST